MESERIKNLGNGYVYSFLPDLNSGEFPLIKEQLKNLRVNYELNHNNPYPPCLAIRIHVREVVKLPTDLYEDPSETLPYLPVTDDSGHSLYFPSNPKYHDHFVEVFCGGVDKWEKVENERH